MSIAKAFIIGNVGSDPEVKDAASGKKFAVFNVAVNPYPGKDKEPVTTWYGVAAFGDNGKFAAQHIKKRSLVVVTGDLTMDEWETDGQHRSRMKIKADSVQFGPSGGGKKDDDGGSSQAAAGGGGSQDDFAPKAASGGGDGTDW